MEVRSEVHRRLWEAKKSKVECWGSLRRSEDWMEKNVKEKLLMRVWFEH